MATKKYFLKLAITIPQEATPYCDIPHKEYLELLKRAHFIVIPLKETFRSIGLAIILEAMSFGKAVITAKVSGTIDYIHTGLDGLLYEPYNSFDLKNKILKLTNDSKFRKGLEKMGKLFLVKVLIKEIVRLPCLGH